MNYTSVGASTSALSTAQTAKNSHNKKVSYFGTKAPHTFKVTDSIIKKSASQVGLAEHFGKNSIKMVEVINSSAKMPYVSKSKKSINESS
jgi:hypothetical protein